jgi:hypothetical protein
LTSSGAHAAEEAQRQKLSWNHGEGGDVPPFLFAPINRGAAAQLKSCRRRLHFEDSVWPAGSKINVETL